MMKFYYGFASKFEAFWRVMKTKDYFMGIMFSDLGEDPRLNFNGNEWTTLYYNIMVEKIYMWMKRCFKITFRSLLIDYLFVL